MFQETQEMCEYERKLIADFQSSNIFYNFIVTYEY